MSLPILISEHPDAGPDALSMDRLIAKVRDEVTGVAMDRHRGSNRELAFVLAKLDEARLWAVAYFETTGSHVLIDKRVFAPTDTTVTTESETAHATP